MFEGNRLPFLKWNLPLEREESLIGYFESMLERNGETSVERFNYFNDLPSQAVSPEQKLEILLRLPLSDALKSQLSAATLYVSDEQTHNGKLFYKLRGQHLITSDLQMHRRRWCPACLAEKSYRRLWFDLSAILTCPYHKGVELTNRDVHGNLVPWYRTSFAGVDIERRTSWPANELEEDTLARYILGRLGCESPVSVPIFDDLRLTTVIWACETVGVLLSNPRMEVSSLTVRPGEGDVGFNVLRHGPGYTTARLRDWIFDNIGPEQRHWSTTAIFSWAYGRANSRPMYEFGPYLMSALHHSVSLARRNVTGAVADEDVGGERLRLADVSQQMKISYRDMQRIARDLGFIEVNTTRRRTLFSSHVAGIRAYVDALCPTHVFCEMTGLPREAGKHLIRVGMVTGYLGAVDGVKGPWFERSSIEALLAKLRAMPHTRNRRHGFAFTAYSRQRLTPGLLAERILSGEMKVVSCDRKGDFRSVLVEHLAEVNPRHARQIGGDLMLLADAANTIGVSRRTMRRLFVNGHIGKVEHDRELRFHRSDVEKFVERYATCASIAHALGKHHQVTFRMAKKAGVAPFVESGKGSYDDTLLLRSDCERAFGRTFPVYLEDEAIQELWSAFVDRAGDVLPNARLPIRLPHRETWIGTPPLDRAARVRIIQGGTILRFDVRPYNMEPFFDFNVGAEHSPDAFDPVFEAISAVGAKLRACANAWKEQKQSANPPSFQNPLGGKKAT